jgi:hypothetical protein
MLRFTLQLPIKGLWRGLSLVAVLSALFTGCANTCFVAVWNPPNGTIGVVAGNPPPACALAKAKAAVRLVAHANRLCEFCSESNRVQSVFLSLRGIDIHLSSNAGDELSHWQELLPQLETRPLQIDLLNESANGSPADSLAERVLIPAGTYDLLRFRFAPNQLGADDEVPVSNACGRLGSNCVVMADGQIEPLVFDADTLESRFTPEIMEGGLFFVLPDSDNELLIELTPVMSIGASLGKGVRFFSLLPSTMRVHRLIVPG